MVGVCIQPTVMVFVNSHLASVDASSRPMRGVVNALTHCIPILEAVFPFNMVDFLYRTVMYEALAADATAYWAFLALIAASFLSLRFLLATSPASVSRQ